MKKYNDQELKDVLAEMMSSRRLKPKLDQLKVKSIWESTMGASINKYTKKISLTKGKLFIKIDSAPLKQELNYGKDKIIKMMNKEIGEEIVTDVIIH